MKVSFQNAFLLPLHCFCSRSFLLSCGKRAVRVIWGEWCGGVAASGEIPSCEKPKPPSVAWVLSFRLPLGPLLPHFLSFSFQLFSIQPSTEIWRGSKEVVLEKSLLRVLCNNYVGMEFPAPYCHAWVHSCQPPVILAQSSGMQEGGGCAAGHQLQV